MRERSHTTPRRRGPKHPLPQDALYHDDSPYEQQESPYYTIDNTEDIYSTTLLPSQRCYVDPWDLENYDYVRKKMGQSPSPRGYYESSASPSPIEEPIHSPYYYEREPLEMAPRMAATMPRKRRTSHYQCQMECCNNVRPSRRPSGIYDVGRRDNYDDYMISHMAQKFQNFNLEDVEPNLYGLYGGASTSSSTEPHSSIGDGDYLTATMPRKSSNYGALPMRKVSKPAPKLEFPAPPPSVPPTYDYCNPYATLPCCSVNDCYECQAVQQQQLQAVQQQSIYGTHSIYGSAPSPDNCYDCSLGSSLGRRPSSSLYSGIYSSKFGMSKKGLLQIDYSCSWNDLDRIMTRNY
ncbi:uncharacterized protein LOC101898544 [Musca domestica]|uniref:Uncharacterized protein LOC101898544 n=1 Tax=Musca domestica TaxID=7370 RepID=A0ABM3VF28_MUSDO|nr:uncharacterized protein LOC101898544 [Musca domestica]XP_058984394.1 uncharacterized protein LOC101898544 [Musca domestica]XP_058984395.1 uncharacterized protein LOC101898544 [Musca domestica]XP_058984396.1 uncharacterized protein LOC101898544 [Musca domestica]XP_058984397.1 uncharacterized protein LOC101898544 [Musca domestica]